MALIFFFFAVLIAMGITIAIGVIIYLVVKRVEGDKEPYERRTN